MMDASDRAKQQAEAIRQLILAPDVVPTPNDSLALGGRTVAARLTRS